MFSECVEDVQASVAYLAPWVLWLEHHSLSPHWPEQGACTIQEKRTQKVESNYVSEKVEESLQCFLKASLCVDTHVQVIVCGGNHYLSK